MHKHLHSLLLLSLLFPSTRLFQEANWARPAILRINTALIGYPSLNVQLSSGKDVFMYVGKSSEAEAYAPAHKNVIQLINTFKPIRLPEVVLAVLHEFLATFIPFVAIFLAVGLS